MEAAPGESPFASSAIVIISSGEWSIDDFRVFPDAHNKLGRMAGGPSAMTEESLAVTSHMVRVGPASIAT